MSEKNNVAGNSVGFLGILQLIFITLKLLNKVDWSWWQVFVPAYIQAGIFLIIVFVVAIMTIINDLQNKKES